jgi:hypothetical protein
MPDATDLRAAVYKATEEFLVGDGPALVDELTDALLGISARVAHVCRTVALEDPGAAELRAVDDAFAHSVTLARRLSVAIRAYQDPGGYVGVAAMVRDLGRQVSTSLPSGVAFSVRIGSNPAIAAMPSSELRRVLAKLIRRTSHDVSNRVEWVLEVVDGRTTDTRERAIRIVLGHDALSAAAAADAADQVRSAVSARGGWVQPCATIGRGATVVVSLPTPC